MKKAISEHLSIIHSLWPEATIFIYVFFSVYFSYELTVGQLWEKDSIIGLTNQQSGIMNLTFTLFVPHIIYIYHILSGRISKSIMAFLSLWFEIGYIGVGSFILIVWCLESDDHKGEKDESVVDSAEPLFILVSLSLAMFEYREKLWGRIKVMWQQSKNDQG